MSHYNRSRSTSTRDFMVRVVASQPSASISSIDSNNNTTFSGHNVATVTQIKKVDPHVSYDIDINKSSIKTKESKYSWKLKFIDACVLILFITCLAAGLATQASSSSNSEESISPTLSTTYAPTSKLYLEYNVSNKIVNINSITILRCQIANIINPTLLSNTLFISWTESNGTIVSVTPTDVWNSGTDCSIMKQRRLSSTELSILPDNPINIIIMIIVPNNIITGTLINQLYFSTKFNYTLLNIKENNQYLPPNPSHTATSTIRSTIMTTSKGTMSASNTKSASKTISSTSTTTRSLTVSSSLTIISTTTNTISETTTPTPSETDIPTSSGTNTPTPSETSTISASSSISYSSTSTDTPTPTASVTSSLSGTASITPTRSFSVTPTSTPPTPAGVTWVANGTIQNYEKVASSADGSNLVAITTSSYIFTSSDGGKTWIQRESARTWRGIAISADGNRMVAAVSNGYIYTSENAGVTWIQRESSRRWYAVASSTSGQYIVGIVYTGQIYTSWDYGVTWIARETNRQWYHVAMSGNGSCIYAIVDQGYIYSSYDYGVTFLQRATSRQWMSITTSYDGMILAANVPNGYLYTSFDAAITWVSRQYADWHCIHSSSTGQIIIAGTYLGQLWTSYDFGVTFTARETNRFWGGVASSADGSRFVAVHNGGYIYTSRSSNAASLSPTPTASVTPSGTCSPTGSITPSPTPTPSFTPLPPPTAFSNQNNFVIVRLGTGGSTTLSTTATVPVSLQEFNYNRTGNTITVTQIQTIMFNTTSTAKSSALTLPVTSSSTDTHGQLSLSDDEYHLLLGGYDTTYGSTTYSQTTTKRCIARIDFYGNIETVASWLPSANYAVCNVASDSATSGRYWFASYVSTTGVYYVGPGQSSPSLIRSGAYRSVIVKNGRLYVTSGGNQPVQYFPVDLPNTTQSSVIGFITNSVYNDARGMEWNPNLLETYTIDIGTGFYRVYRANINSTSWTKSLDYKAAGGAVATFLDLALMNDNITLLLTTTTGVYAFRIDTLTWYNNGAAIITAPTNTQIRGISKVPRMIPSPSP